MIWLLLFLTPAIAPAIRRSFLMTLIPRQLLPMFNCSLCLGYHVGWVSYLIILMHQTLSEGQTVVHEVDRFIPMFLIAFGVSIASYAIDQVLRLIELTIDHLNLSGNSEELTNERT
jgi:hypothetical protein